MAEGESSISTSAEKGVVVDGFSFMAATQPRPPCPHVRHPVSYRGKEMGDSSGALKPESLPPEQAYNIIGS
jgi:hypothetical protein